MNSCVVYEDSLPVPATIVSLVYLRWEACQLNIDPRTNYDDYFTLILFAVWILPFFIIIFQVKVLVKVLI